MRLSNVCIVEVFHLLPFRNANVPKIPTASNFTALKLLIINFAKLFLNYLHKHLIHTLFSCQNAINSIQKITQPLLFCSFVH